MGKESLEMCEGYWNNYQCTHCMRVTKLCDKHEARVRVHFCNVEGIGLLKLITIGLKLAYFPQRRNLSKLADHYIVESSRQIVSLLKVMLEHKELKTATVLI